MVSCLFSFKEGQEIYLFIFKVLVKFWEKKKKNRKQRTEHGNVSRAWGLFNFVEPCAPRIRRYFPIDNNSSQDIVVE